MHVCANFYATIHTMNTAEKVRIELFRRTVLGFYARHGRVFPWRETRDPYHILVSEFMLQQTQVSRVLVKYPEFLARFPTVKALARASVADVVSAWRGMGYNRRALALQKSARIIVREYGGNVPGERDGLLSLPGVGQSTAGAVRAFAFDAPSVFIETNIRRAVIHFFFPKKKSVTDREVRTILEQALPRKHFRAWHYALMDYGSHLPKIVGKNPNHQSKHYKKQSKFEGSHRQARANILSALVDHGKLDEVSLRAVAKRDAGKTSAILSALVSEGFIVKKGRVYKLAE